MRRRILQSMLVLVLAILATVAVSWVLLATVALKASPSAARGWAGVVPPSWGTSASTTWRLGVGVRVIEQESELVGSSTSAIAAAALLAMPASADVNRLHRIECGWPWRGLRSVQRDVFAARSGNATGQMEDLGVWKSGLAVRSKLLPAGAFARARLPLEPVWPAFALDVAFFAGLLTAAPWGRRGVLWMLRRRCALCTACGYPAGATAVCSECGGPVRPWTRPAEMPRRPTRAQAWATRALMAAAGVSIVAYLFSGLWSLYAKGPWGVYVAVWRGRVALGRASGSFDQFGLELRRVARSFALPDAREAGLVGELASVPLWAPLLLLGLVGVMAWWRLAVRRGLAQHGIPLDSLGIDAHYT